MKAGVFLVMLFLVLSACAHIAQKDGPLLSAKEHMRLASIYEAGGEYEAALTQYGYAAKADPLDGEVHFVAGNVNLRLKRFKEAEAHYKKAIALNPGDARSYNNLAWSYIGSNNLEEARGAVMEALEIGGEKRHAYLDTLAVIDMKEKDFSKAESHLVEAADMAREKEDVEGLRSIYNHLLQLYRSTGREDKAARVEEKLKSIF
ncbi:MAG: hypothetical protein BMS9Abin23_0587 [Thermodesulfobacteriota bacterium]|nr:MAG: hypothetical protein BMS9Abin23_0587 [Thermodesulfobacteriota bacterium]